MKLTDGTRKKPNINLWQQRCEVCGRPDIVDFYVKTETWKRVVPTQFSNSAVCLICFDAFASVRNVDYVSDLDAELCFEGLQGSLLLRIKTRNSANTVNL